MAGVLAAAIGGRMEGVRWRPVWLMVFTPVGSNRAWASCRRPGGLWRERERAGSLSGCVLLLQLRGKRGSCGWVKRESEGRGPVCLVLSSAKKIERPTGDGRGGRRLRGEDRDKCGGRWRRKQGLLLFSGFTGRDSMGEDREGAAAFGEKESVWWLASV